MAAQRDGAIYTRISQDKYGNAETCLDQETRGRSYAERIWPHTLPSILRRPTITDPAEVAGIARAVADVLTATAARWEGRRGGPLTEAAEVLDRAACRCRC